MKEHRTFVTSLMNLPISDMLTIMMEAITDRTDMTLDELYDVYNFGADIQSWVDEVETSVEDEEQDTMWTDM